MRKIYFISGLGADERVFQLLSLPKSYDCMYIQWLVPYQKETLVQYVNRLKVQINSGESCVLIGVSFGGIVAIELAKLLKPEKTIIISSIASASDLPVYLRIAGKLNLHQIIPAGLLKKVNFLMYYFFGVREQHEKALLKTIIEETDEKFLEWAIHQILNWKSEKSIE